MRKYLILCMSFCAFAVCAQKVAIISCDYVHDGFYPELSADGTKMLLTSENYAGLSVLDLQQGNLIPISQDANAGYQPLFSTDNSTVFFRSKEFKNGYGYVSVKSCALSNGSIRILLSPRRDVGRLVSYGNGVLFNQGNQLRKATFGKTAVPVPAFVSNENLDLVLYKDGKRTVLHPYAEELNYIWSSLSPDGQKILFNTKYGTAVCDLEGNILVELGHLNAPVWFNDNLVVGMYDVDDGHVITASTIAMVSLDGRLDQRLTDGAEIAMYPSVSAQSGKIAFNTLDGKIYVMTVAVE